MPTTKLPSPVSRCWATSDPTGSPPVMGTGIVAAAGATLPVHIPGLRTFTQIVWGGGGSPVGGPHRGGRRALAPAPDRRETVRA